MSDSREFDTEELTRQPRGPSAGDANDQISAEDALEEMRGQLERAEAARREAEAAAHQERTARAAAETQVTQASNVAISAQEQQLESTIAAETTRAAQAKTALAHALAAGDAGAAADAQMEIARAAAALDRLDQNKQWFAAEKARAASEQQRRPQQSQQAPAGTVQVRTPGGAHQVTQNDKDWMDQHPRFYEDQDYYNHAIASHSTLVAQGAQPGTPIYYKGLSDAMSKYEEFDAHRRGEGGTVDNGLSQRQQQRRAPASSFSAPVSRASAPRQPSNGAFSEQEICRFIGPGVTPADLREYAMINGLKGEQGYQSYLEQQSEIIRRERSGQPTGMNQDMAWR